MMYNSDIIVLYSINRSNYPKSQFEPYTIQSSLLATAHGKWLIRDDRQSKESKVEIERILYFLQNEFNRNGEGRFFQLLREDEELIKNNKALNYDAVIQDNTPSVLLGLYLTLVQEIRGKSFSKKWSSVTVTGIINIVDNKIKLVEPDEILEKFKDYKSYISNLNINVRDKHLFIYVSDKEIEEIKNERNIKVKCFNPNTPIKDIENYVFERQWEDELQRFLHNNLRNRNHNIEYVKSEEYLKIENELFIDKNDGYLILGEGESGKSDMAEAITRHLIDEDDSFYAPLWIYVANNELKESVSYNLPMEGAIREYITKKIKERPELSDFSDLSKFLQERKYILIIDNLEIDNIEDVLKGINLIIKDIEPEKKPYLIITSRTGKNDNIASRTNKDDKKAIAIAEEEMKLKAVYSPKLCKGDIEELFARIIDSDNLLLQLKEEAQYNEFIEMLDENFNSFPGLIIPAVNPIKHGIIMESLLPDLRGMHDDRIEEKALKIYRTVFSMLEDISHTVLFNILNMISPDTKVNEEKIINSVEKSPDIIKNILSDLVNKMIIFKEEENNLIQYGMKGVAFLIFMFGDIYNNKERLNNKKQNLRKQIVDDKWSLHMALRYEKSDEIIEELIKDIKDPSEIGYIYYKEALIRNPKNYIKKSLEYHRKALDEALDNNEKGNEHYVLIIRRYLQALNRATRINESWDELSKFLKEIGADLPDAELQKEIGDAHYSLGFYIERTEEHYTLANIAYETAINLYSKETDINAIRLTMINQAMNYGALSEVPNSAVKNHKTNCLEKAKDILLNNDYFNEDDVTKENDLKEYVEKEMALANIYIKIAEVTSDKKDKEKSINLYNNAISVYSSINDRIGEAFAWAELSVAYMNRPKNEEKEKYEEDVKESIKACTDHALKVFHKNDFPVYYAETKNHLGNARKAQIDKERIDEKFFKITDEIFEEAEVIFQGDKMYHFMAGRVKHNRGDLYLKYALICPNGKKEKYFKRAIETLNDANEYRKKYPRYHVPTLRILGYTHLKYSLIIPENSVEKKNQIEDAIKIFNIGLKIYEKEALNLSGEYKWLYHNLGLAHEQLYKYTKNITDINTALSAIEKTRGLASDDKERKRFDDDYNRILNLKTAGL